MTEILDVLALREQFPALARPLVFLDGPGGSQVPRRVAEAMSEYLLTRNANCGGAFTTSRETVAGIAEARAAVAAFLGAPTPDEIAFGQNMTSLTFAFTRAVAATLRPGDEVLLTRLDHDANVSPWVRAARDAGATVRYVELDPADCGLDMADFEAKLSSRTRWVAVTMASNSTGSVTDLTRLIPRARAAGARVFVDAVHMAPHGPIDVSALGCDALACSAYKFFGPHIGMLWARREVYESLSPYKVRPASDRIPGAWETGTQNHEAIAGTLASLHYLADIGRRHGAAYRAGGGAREGLALDLHCGMTAIREHEKSMTLHMLSGLGSVPGLKIYGIRDLARIDERVPTFVFRLKDLAPRAVAERLAQQGIMVWSGNFYALELTERLEIEAAGGFVRAGALHYNTPAEVDRLVGALREIAG